MPGHPRSCCGKKIVDARDKPGHDDVEGVARLTGKFSTTKIL
jgi:hypothetical protein